MYFQNQVRNTWGKALQFLVAVASIGMHNGEWSTWEGPPEESDPPKIWHVIGWKVELKLQNSGKTLVDNDFKLHFEELLDLSTKLHWMKSPRMHPTSLSQMIQMILMKLQSSPKSKLFLVYVQDCWNGCWTYCPKVTFVYIVYIFNCLHCRPVSIPVQWCTSRLTVILKESHKLCCGNYHGISAMNTLAKTWQYLE